MQPGRASGMEAADGANRAVLTDEEWRRVHSRREGFDGEEEDEYLSLSNEEIEDRIDAAAAFISVVHDLRPLDPRAFNASLEVWRQIRRVPPWCRHRLLSELEPGTGAIRALWKASMARYVLDDARALELARGWTIWQDFPEDPGQVYNYVGKCEQFVLTGPQVRFFKERGPPEPPRPAPWLKPTDGSYDIQAQDFRMQFFVQPQTGELFARVVFPWLGTLLERWWLPVYLRLKMELTLTPLKGDAGADLTFEYAFPDTVDLNGWLGDAELLHEQLPDKRWPRPDPLEACGSPFSISPRDYVRPAGPGVYVGCAYRGPEPGVVNEDECVFFVIARKMSRMNTSSTPRTLSKNKLPFSRLLLCRVE